MAGNFIIRLYNADNSRWRPVTLSNVAAPVSWSLTREHGYAQATLTLLGKPADFSGLSQRRRIEFLAHEPGSSVWIRLYRGYIAKIDPRRGKPRQTVVTLWGIAWRAGKSVSYQRYPFPYAMEAANVYSVLVSKWVRSKPEFSSLDILPVATGQTVDYLDAWRKRVSDSVSELLKITGGQTVTGGDVNAEGLDRLFFRPFGSPSAPDHTIQIPSPRTGTREREEDTTRIANVLDLVGGGARYGGNLLAQVVEGNTSFEVPAFEGDGSGNLLDDPGFEARSGWTLSGGASYKAGGESDTGATDGGDDMVELDNVGEKVARRADVPAGGWAVGANYIFDIRARLKAGGAPIATARVLWKNGADATIQTDTLAVAPASAVWDSFSLTSKAPAGAANADVEIELTTDGGDGILLDNLAFYDQSFLYQAGFEVAARGTAERQKLNWVYNDAYHGAYCIFVQGLADDADGDDIAVRPRGEGRISVVGNQTIRFTVWMKSPPGASGIPKLQQQIHEYDSGGGRIDDPRQNHAAGAALGAWTQYEMLHTVSPDCVAVSVELTLRGDGEFLTDAWMVTDGSLPATPFFEGGNFEGVFRAADLFADGGSDDDIHDSAEDWGELPELEEQSSVTTEADAESYATAFFRSRALPLAAPSIEIFGKPAEYWPGEYVRAIGAEGQDILPEPLPIAEVEGVWDGKLTLTLHLVTEKPDEARKIRELVRKAAKGGGGMGGGASAGQVSPPTGTGSSTVKVSTTDAAADYLQAKITPGSGVTVTKNTDGSGVETLAIAATTAAPKRRWVSPLLRGFVPEATGIDTDGEDEAPYGAGNTSITWVPKRVLFRRSVDNVAADTVQVLKSTAGIDAAFGAGTDILAADLTLSGAADFGVIKDLAADFVTALTVASGKRTAAEIIATSGAALSLSVEYEEA
jgi:hypothetical protein